MIGSLEMGYWVFVILDVKLSREDSTAQAEMGDRETSR